MTTCTICAAATHGRDDDDEELTRMVGWLEASGYTAMHFPSLSAA